MLKVDNINVYYGKIHALKDVSLEVHPGEIVALTELTARVSPLHLKLFPVASLKNRKY